MKKLTLNPKPLMVLLMLLTILFVMPQGAQAQNYTLGGDYVKFQKFVQLNPDEAAQYVVTTEAEAGETVTASIDPDKIPQGKYFTGVYTSQDVTLTTDWDGATFTMPAKDVTVNAVLANQEDYTIDLTSSTSAVIPMEISTLLSYMEVGGQTCSVYDKDYNWFLDLNVDGTPDLEVKSTFDQTIQDHIFSIEVLSGSGVYKTSCSFALDTPTPERYKSLIFKFKEVVPVVTLQSGWISLSSVSFTYDGTEHKPTVTVNDGTADITRYFDIKYKNNTNAAEATATNAPTVTVTATGEGYTGSVTKTFTITPKPVTISGVKAKDRVYDGTTAAEIDAGSATFDGKVGNDEVNIVAGSAAFADANAGKGIAVTFSGFTLTGASAGNYVLSAQPTSVTGTIVPKPVTITADGETKEYDGQPLTKNSYTHTPLASGDAIKSVTVTGSQTDAGTSENVPSGAVIQNAANENVTANYAITYANGTLTVTKASLNITAEGYSGVYDGTAHGITVKNVPEGLTVQYSEDNTNFGSNELKYTNVCDETVYWKVDNDNYDLTSGASGNAQVTITPKEVTVTANDAFKTEGEADPELTYTVDGLVKDDKMSGSLSREAGENPGTYDINEGTLSAGGNYKIKFIIGTFTINAQPNPAPEPDPVTENVIETNTETVTNLDGSTTTIVTQKLETAGSSFTIDGEGGVSKGDGSGSGGDEFSEISKVIQELLNRNVIANAGSASYTLNPILVRTGDASNVLINSVTEKDAEGQTTATSVSLTVKQTGDSDPTQIAICAGGGVNPDAPTSGKCGEKLTWKLSMSEGSDVYDVLTISGSGWMEDGSPWSDYKKQIKTVIIGEGVRSIGNEAFQGFSSLTSVTIPAGVTSIGYSAFSGCSSLMSIDIPVSVTSIGDKAFRDCSAMTSLTFAEGSQLQTIGDYAFDGLTSLTSDIILPASVTSIGISAFSSVSNNTTDGIHVYITVPDGKKLKVTIAGVTDPVEFTPTNGKADIIDCLFDDSSKRIASRALTLKIVDASTGGEGGGDNGGGSENPDAPTSGKCGKNVTWTLTKSDANSTVYDVLTISGSGKMENGSPWKAYKDQIKTVIIGEGVTSIGSSAFYFCSSLTSVNIPEHLTSIGVMTFFGCSSLKSVTIPAGVTSIGINTFHGCSAMTSLTFAEGSQLQTIDDYAFYGLTSLTSDIILPASVTSIGISAFSSVSKNTTDGIHITAAEGSQLTAIHTDAFSYANASIDLSNCIQLEAIGSDLVFRQVSGDVTLPSSVTSICQYAFGYEYSTHYPGKHVYVTVPQDKALKVTIDNAEPVLIAPNDNGMADIIGSLFDDSSIRIASRALTLEIVDPSTGDDNGGGSASGQGQEPSAREKNDRAATTMIVNYETKKVTVGAGSGDAYGVKSKVTANKYNTVNFTGGTVNHIIGGGTRGATAEEEEEDDEIEIVSGQEYEILHDGYVVLNFYTPDADITVKSIVFRRPGDANNDGYVDAADLVEMINAKNGHASERFNLANADIDRDGTITQDDIDAVVKMIME